MELNFKKFGNGKPLIILHGLFGSLDNWVSLGKGFADYFTVYLVDQRNHGQSPHSDEMSYDLMADDIIEFIENQRIVNPVIMGHSMGGKTAMYAVLKRPELFSALIVVDMAPKGYAVHHRQILDGLLYISDQTLNSRSEADELLSKYVPEIGVRQFLLKNLYWKNKDELELRFNLKVLNENIEALGEWKSSSEKYSGPVLFIRGGKSDYIDENEANISLNFPNADLKTIEEAGHWIHAESPDKFFKMVVSFAN